LISEAQLESFLVNLAFLPHEWLMAALVFLPRVTAFLSLINDLG